ASITLIKYFALSPNTFTNIGILRGMLVITFLPD
ncbi:hypothetical protein VCHC59A1_3692B, partial [Vibrio cholerae HC-59A1]